MHSDRKLLDRYMWREENRIKSCVLRQGGRMSIYGGGSESSVLAVHLTLEPDSQLDAEEYERMTRQLRAELKDLDVESVRLATTETAPAGAKGDPVTVGALIVALSASGGVFTTLIAALHDWLRRRSGNHRIRVTIDGDTIELERASAEREAELVDAFVRRHSVM
jgi:hypothetical protein